jgi:DNA-binding NarL/FixJ family response regulator
MRKQINVLLVDDHAVVRTGLRRLLEDSENFQVVAEAETGKDAYMLFREHKPDVVVMDLSLPGIGGLETIQRILAVDRDARIIAFTMHESPMLAERAIKAGAVGYIIKRSAPETLVEAIRKAVSNQIYIDPFIAQELVIGNIRGTRGILDTLSPRELEIFRLIVDGHTTRVVAKTLHLSEKTIANNISQIKKKLGVTSTTELVRLAFQEGIISH